MQKAHEWLPKGWFVEIRAGGENMDKMFKVIIFYLHRIMSRTNLIKLTSKAMYIMCASGGSGRLSLDANV
jgi:hypothetical protein